MVGFLDYEVKIKDLVWEFGVLVWWIYWYWWFVIGYGGFYVGGYLIFYSIRMNYEVWSLDILLIKYNYCIFVKGFYDFNRD